MKKYSPITDEQAGLLTIRDPMILPVGGTYYMTGTQPPYWTGENDGVHLWSTKDLCHFEDHGLIIRRADMPEQMWCRDRFWAPELFDGGNGWFYLTFNCRNDSHAHPHPHNVALARSREVTGPYEIVTPERALPEPAFTDCNDATMFRDDDGSLWMAFNNTTEWLTLHRFDPDTLTLCESMRVAKRGGEGEWDRAGVEGPCIVKRHGIYFMWYSSWTNGYNAGLLTADSIRGPWKKHPANPILGDNDIWFRAGHNHSFRAFDGQDYLIFHANSRDPEDSPAESLFIVLMEYRADGSVCIMI